MGKIIYPRLFIKQYNSPFRRVILQIVACLSPIIPVLYKYSLNLGDKYGYWKNQQFFSTARTKIGLTQKELADKIGVSDNTLNV